MRDGVAGSAPELSPRANWGAITACSELRRSLALRVDAETLRRERNRSERHTVIRGAATDREGACWFRVGNAAAWYGQSVVPDAEIASELNANAQLWSEIAIGDGRLQRVRCVDLRAVVRDLPVVDYMHMDIQGAEADFLEAHPDILQRRVRAVNIGTHSTEIEDRLRALFTRLQWRCAYDVRLQTAPMVKVGSGEAKRIEFGDGVQVWINPSLAPAGSQDH